MDDIVCQEEVNFYKALLLSIVEYVYTEPFVLIEIICVNIHILDFFKIFLSSLVIITFVRWGRQ